MAKIRNDKGKGLRCYIYTRVSTEMQIDGYSLDAQEESLRKAAAYHEMQVVHVFSDEGKSGKNTTGRPEFQEMMRRISNGNEDRVDYVLVFKLSRFGRNTADVLNNVQLMEDYSVNLMAVEDKIDSAGSAGKLMISVIAAVAEIERENINAQTMAGRRQKAKEGKWNGGQAPYGYRIKDGVLEIDEAEAEVVRLIFDRYNHYEQGANGVARWLNNTGYTKKTVKNREGTAFSAHFIKIILDNPVYIGKIAYGRRKTEKIEGTRNEFHKVKQAEGDYDIWEGRHPAIIDEKTWLASHGTVKVGYMKDYLPFCAKDPETRQLTGALKEYLEYAAGAIQNADLKFDAIAFDTIGEAIEALKAGQVNCVFPANFGEADAEEMGLIITPSVMSAEIYEIVREDDLHDFGKKRNVKVAVDEGNVNYEKVLSEKFPDFEVVYYRNIKSCLQAVADGKADTVLVSNFRYNNLTKQCDKLGLTPIATGIGMGNAFVAVRGNIELYSLLNKTVNMVPASKTNSVMTLYISEKEEELTFTEFVMKHLAEVMGIVAGVLLVILALSMRTIRAMKRARRDEKLIASAETDQLTGVYSKNFLFEYARRMQNKHKNKPMDAIVVDIERFHSINTLNGQEAGDQVLRTLGEVLRTVFNDINPDLHTGHKSMAFMGQ